MKMKNLSYCAGMFGVAALGAVIFAARPDLEEAVMEPSRELREETETRLREIDECYAERIRAAQAKIDQETRDFARKIESGEIDLSSVDINDLITWDSDTIVDNVPRYDLNTAEPKC